MTKLLNLPDGVTLSEITVKLQQEADCCDPEGPLQFLDITTQDGGGGHFLILGTTRWALSDAAGVDALAAVLKEILAAMPDENKP